LFTRTVQAVDSHTEGNPTRVVLAGTALPALSSLVEQRDWIRRHDDRLRRLLNFEPRGSAMMCSVLLLPPLRPEADFGAVLMEQDEYVPMCGHCIIGAATTVVETGMVPRVTPTTTVRFDTPAGIVSCAVDVSSGRSGTVSLTNVPSFLLHRDARVAVPELGTITVDVAFGGDFYAIVDADELGVEIRPDNDVPLVEAAGRIIPALNDQLVITHPDRPDIDRCYETLFTTSRTTVGEAKHAVVSPPGALDRSPCGTGTSARLADMYTRGSIALDQAVTFEGFLGTTFTGTVLAAEERHGLTFVRPRIAGRAYITGYHTFVLDPEDPFPDGYRVGRPPRDVEHD
jgi:proline racemase